MLPRQVLLGVTPPGAPTAPSRVAMGAGAFIGALVGGMAGSMTKPHYEDIQTGGANRTAVYADVASGQATVGAAIGALLGGLLGSLKTTDASA